MGGRKKSRYHELFPGRPQAFRYQRRPVDDYSPGQGGRTQDGGTWGRTFHGDMDRRCRGSQGWTMACSGMPELDGKTKERIAQSKCARAGSLAIVY